MDDKLKIKEKLGNYESVIYSNLMSIDSAHKQGRSGYIEMRNLTSSLIPEILDEDLINKINDFEADVAVERTRVLKYLRYHHCKNNGEKEQPIEWCFWSERHIQDVLSNHLVKFTIARVQNIKNLIYMKLAENGLLLTSEKQNLLSEVLH